ncbi:MAG TPA: acyl-CoA dehydrogenase family protein [Solirubrobacteraceae bacterium]|jgi:alkylation response protein AidB-like acyl-CoA dehydrogenase|nr:acyl-CoA dehydrogenase family protein [Solirubrobacteraceae bacterium]
MNFDYTDDQRDIKRTAHDLLAKRSTPERVRQAAEARRYDDELWRELCQLGWPGIAVSEQHGGQGLGTVELATLLEELGYAVACTPLLGTVSAALVIDQAGSEEQRAHWLPKLSSGEARGALGVLAGGEAPMVADAGGADVVVLVGEGEGQVLDAAQADIEVLETIDPTRGYARVRGSGDALAGDPGPGLDRATVAVAAELVGICQRALDMTLEYVKDRKQFNTPVGAYQAVSHRCAQMLMSTESARSATLFAAWTADADPDRLAEGAALAKAASSDAGREVTASAIQAHGGIGFTWEADVHWLYKRAQLDAALLGGARAHRARLAEIVGRRLTATAA